MNISSSNLEEIIKEMLSEEIKKMKESDLVYKNKKDWIDAKSDLKSDMSELIDNIESDDYADGVSKIEKVISSLNKWKKSINNQLNNGK